MIVHQVIMTEFCMEVEVTVLDFVGKWWVIFVYLSTKEGERRRQWEMLQQKKRGWGQRWLIGGDFNDIIGAEDKQGGRRRLESSYQPFRSFIRTMEMEVVAFKGRRWTWANNRVGEGFIEE